MKKKKTSSASAAGLSHVPFGVLLLVLTLVNFLLAYAPLSVTAKLWFFLGGILAPLAYWYWKGRQEGAKAPALRSSGHFLVPSGAWFFFLGAAVLLRFWKIDSLFVWPTGDEGLIGAAALELSHQWDWKFFYTVGQNPPAFVWLCALFFKVFRDPLFNMWAPSALVSLATLVMGVLAARQVLSKPLSLVFGSLLAFSYWPLYLGRRCLPAVTAPLGEFALIFCLAKAVKAEGPWKVRWAFLAGVCLGAQSFTYVAWPVVAFAGALAFAYLCWKGIARKGAGAFGAGALLGLAPFILALLREGYGQHISALTPWSGWFRDRDILSNAVSYLGALFWGGPGEGGALNPLLCSFFFLGLVELFLPKRRELAWAAAGTFLLFLLPGVLSLNLQTFRVVQVLPLLLFVTALGARALLEGPGRWKVPILAALLVLSAFFDWGRLLAPYIDINGHPQPFLSTGKSLSRYRAYSLLKELETRAGPGVVLGEWDLPADRTLGVATLPFNVVLNRGLASAPVKWLALVTDAHYRPFLQKRFPKGECWVLDTDLVKDGTRMLAVLPFDAAYRPALLRWAQADQAFRDLNWGTDHVHEKGCFERVVQNIREDHPLIQGDPFLESVFWEKAGEFFYYYGDHFPEHLQAMRLSTQRGVPAAHLYGKLAGLWQIAGNGKEAQRALESARRSEALYPWREKN